MIALLEELQGMFADETLGEMLPAKPAEIEKPVPIAVPAQTAEQPKPISRQLPPTHCDFEIYQAVVFDGESQREVAGRYRLSQSRVRQLLQKVAEFLVQVVPGEFSPEERKRRLGAAEGLARLQLERYAGQLLQMWEKSQTVPGAHGLGKATYVTAAMRIGVALAKLPLRERPPLGDDPHEPEVVPLTADRDPREVYNTRIAELLRNDPAAKAEFDRDYPPIEYCSLNGVTKIPVVENDYYLRRMAASTCAPAETPAKSQKSRASTPAQPTPTRDCAPPAADAKPAGEPAKPAAKPVAEPSVEPAREPIAEPDREPIVPLTRQQRRARERQLKHKLRQRG